MQVFGRTSLAFTSKDKSIIPRMPEDEGLFVESRPDIPDFNLYKMEARLLREDLRRKVFFDENGDLKLCGKLIGDTEVRSFEVTDIFMLSDMRYACFCFLPLV